MLNRLLVPPCSYPHWTDNINNKLGQRVKCELVEKFELPSMHSLLESNTMSWADISRTCNCHSLIVSLESFQTNLKAKTNYYCCRAKFEPIILLKECATFLFHTYFHPHTHTHTRIKSFVIVHTARDRQMNMVPYSSYWFGHANSATWKWKFSSFSIARFHRRQLLLI
jgi:hypothetical protein